MRGLVVAVILLIFAGCLEAPDESLLPNKQYASAEEMYAEAVRRAMTPREMEGPDGAKWTLPHAEESLAVAAIFALESGHPGSEWRLMGSNYHLVHHRSDPDLGDGQAPAWGFLFQDDSIYTFEQAIAVDGSSSSWGTGGYPSIPDGYVTLGAKERTFTKWTLDSVDAARIAGEQEQWTSALKMADWVAMLLHRPVGQDDPYWLLGAHTPEDHPLAHVLVNAQTGEVEDVWSVYPPHLAEGEASARLTALDDATTFEVGEADTNGVAHLRFRLLGDPLATVRYHLVDQDQVILAEGEVSRRTYGTYVSELMEENAPYTVRFELDEGGFAEVRMDTCFITHGSMHLFGIPQMTCENMFP